MTSLITIGVGLKYLLTHKARYANIAQSCYRDDHTSRNYPIHSTIHKLVYQFEGFRNRSRHNQLGRRNSHLFIRYSRIYRALQFFIKPEQKKHHYNRLVEDVLSKPVSKASVSIKNGEPSIQRIRWVEDNKLYVFLEKHLEEEYSEVWKLLTDAKNETNQLIRLYVNQYQELRALIEKKAGDEIPLKLTEDYIDDQTPYCVFPTLMQAVYSETESTIRRGRSHHDFTFEDEVPHADPTKKISMKLRKGRLIWGAREFAIGTRGEREAVKDFILSQTKAPESLEHVRKMIKLSEKIQSNAKLSEFNMKRDEIVLQVREGSKKLKGKCDLCP